MKEESKDLVVLEKETIFKKILKFFRSLFGKKEKDNETKIQNEVPEVEDNRKAEFKDSLKGIIVKEDDLRKLQKMFHQGQIKEEELTEEQKAGLNNLYDAQINELQRRITEKGKMRRINNN